MKTYSPSMLNSNEAHISASRIYKITMDLIPDDPFLKTVGALLTPNFNDLSVIISRTNDSTYVKLLEKKDDTRDGRFVGLRDFCKAMAGDENPALSTPGKFLVDIFKELGWSMHREGYSVESSLLKSLIEKFEKAPVSTYVTAIGATARLASLKTAQSDFENTFNNKVDAKAKEVYPKMQECRRRVARYLGGILSYIDLMAETKGGNYQIAANKIDEVITEFGAMARNRQTRKETDKKNKASGAAS